MLRKLLCLVGNKDSALTSNEIIIGFFCSQMSNAIRHGYSLIKASVGCLESLHTLRSTVTVFILP